MTDLSRTCCLSGHRIIPAAERHALAERLRQTLTELIERGYSQFLTGGALGFDTLGAQTVLSLKDEYPHIRLVLVLPCATQTAGWRRSHVQVYEDIRNRCDECVCLSDFYYEGCMQVRNRYMVDHSSACVCYLTSFRGGTAYTVKYAEEQELDTINLA